MRPPGGDASRVKPCRIPTPVWSLGLSEAQSAHSRPVNQRNAVTDKSPATSACVAGSRSVKPRSTPCRWVSDAMKLNRRCMTNDRERSHGLVSAAAPTSSSSSTTLQRVCNVASSSRISESCIRSPTTKARQRTDRSVVRERGAEIHDRSRMVADRSRAVDNKSVAASRRSSLCNRSATIHEGRASNGIRSPPLGGATVAPTQKRTVSRSKMHEVATARAKQTTAAATTKKQPAALGRVTMSCLSDMRRSMESKRKAANVDGRSPRSEADLNVITVVPEYRDTQHSTRPGEVTL